MVDEEEDGVDVVIAVVEESTESISKVITVWLKASLKFEGLSVGGYVV